MKKKQSLFLSFTSETLWADIQEFAKLKYQVSCELICLHLYSLLVNVSLIFYTITSAV